MEHKFELKWTRHALKRIELIEGYVASHDPLAARKLARLIRSTAQMLC